MKNIKVVFNNGQLVSLDGKQQIHLSPGKEYAIIGDDDAFLEEEYHNPLNPVLNEEDKERLFELVRKLKTQGAEKVVLGCTDLPLLMTYQGDLIDTIQVLAEATVKMAQYQ